MESIAFVIVTHDSAEQIGACLESIVNQGLESFHITVVDNASSDGTVEAIEQSGFRVELIINETNHGFAAACNTGVSPSDARYVMLLNPDAILCPGAVKTLVAALQSDEGVGIVGPRLKSPDGELLPSAYRLPTVFQELGFLLGLRRVLLVRPFRLLFGAAFASRFGQFDPHDRRKAVESVLGACMMIKRQVWEALGGFDEGFFLFYEEKDFCKRAKEAGFATMFVPQAEAIHSIGASVRQKPHLAAAAKRASMIYYYSKHKGVIANCVVRGALFANVLFHCLKDILACFTYKLSPEELRARLFAWRSVLSLLGGRKMMRPSAEKQ